MKRPSAGYLMRKRTGLKDPNTGVMIDRSIRKLSGLILLLLVSFTWVTGQKAECIAVHMDKSFYVSGEIIWYKVYQLNDSGEAKSRVLHVELINNENETIARQKLLISNRTSFGSITLPLDSKEGYYKFRAYTHYNLNFKPTFIFETNIPVYQLERENYDIPYVQKTDKLQLPETSGVLNITSQKILKPRDSLTVSIQVSNENYSGDGNFSVSIVPIDLAYNLPVYSPEKCIDEIGDPGDQLPGDQLIDPEQTLFIEGTLIDPNTKLNVTSGLISIYTDISSNLLRASSIDGLIKVPVPDYWGPGVFQILNLDPYQPPMLEFIPKKESIVNSPYFNSIRPFRSQIVLEYMNKLEKRRKFVELFDLYKTGDTKFSTVTPRLADAVYQTADYKQIYSFEEFINEAIRNVKVRTIKGVKTVRLFSKEMGDLFMDHPWYIVDGYLTFDEEEVLNIQYEDILEVRLYTKPSTINKYFERFMWRNGIMEIVTRDVKYTRKLKNNPNVVEIEGFSNQRKFSNSLYLSKSLEIPDLRGVMYWSPNVLVDETGLAKITVPLSDDTGKFAIVVVGTTNFHDVVTGFNTFEVK